MGKRRGERQRRERRRHPLPPPLPPPPPSPRPAAAGASDDSRQNRGSRADVLFDVLWGEGQLKDGGATTAASSFSYSRGPDWPPGRRIATRASPGKSNTRSGADRMHHRKAPGENHTRKRVPQRAHKRRCHCVSSRSFCGHLKISGPSMRSSGHLGVIVGSSWGRPRVISGFC